MLQNLEYFAEKSPSDIHVRHILNNYIKDLEQLSSEIEISKIETNPFMFTKKENPQSEIENWFDFDFNDPHLQIYTGQRCNLMYNSMHSEESMSTRRASNLDYSLTNTQSKCRISKKDTKDKNKLCKNSSEIIYENYRLNTGKFAKLSSMPNRIEISEDHNKKIIAKITHLQDPSNFYIQLEDNLQLVRGLTNKYIHFETYQNQIPSSIDIGSIYMVHYDNDKQWYRCLVERAVSKDVYEGFLVDIGKTLEIESKSFRNINPDDAYIPFAAVQSTLYELMPVGKNWTTESINFFISLTKNNRLCIQLIDVCDQYWKIDILTLVNGETISVRDSFLYTGLARSLTPQTKTQAQASLKNRMLKQILHSAEVLNVEMRHVESPQEFYVIKSEHLTLRHKIVEDLTEEYDTVKSTLTPIPLGLIFMACAVQRNNTWNRGRIEEILDEGKVRVFLVDEGITETFVWHNLYPLKTKFKQQREYTLKCRLTDIEPLRENGYVWTDEAISEFKTLSSNPMMVMTVHNEMPNEYLVSLYLIRKEWNANIGALLVKSGHGISTGKHTMMNEILKINNNNLDTSESAEKFVMQKDMPCNNISCIKSDASVRTLKRSSVKVMNIINPGHLYLQLTAVLPNIENFLAHLQVSNEHLKTMPTPDYNWYIGDHCLVFADLQQSYNQENLENCTCYRGVIYDIDYDVKPSSPYSIFLRDYGIILSDIKDFQLRTIPNEFDRVANSVFCCHLACIKPTGGQTEWSKSAIDCLKNLIEKIPNISATLYGERDPNSKSTPILLWGTTVEITDPLAPTVTKHTCINRLLVNTGLAHLTDRFDFRKQVDELIAKELNDNEISIEEWFNNFNKSIDLKAIDQVIKGEDDTINDDNLAEYACIWEKENENRNPNICHAEETPRAWLEYKDIQKTLFVARPTYLDADCIIYLHDSEDDKILSEICAHINSVYVDYLNKTNSKETSPHVRYRNGQACIAKYHLDSKYYRCLIHGFDNASKTYIVRFIDYGNMENVPWQDVHPFAPFPQMPAFASRYRLHDIRPKNGATKYSTKVLDTIHNLIVNKLLKVRLVDNQLTEKIKYCHICVNGVDLVEFLYEKQLVDRDWSSTKQHKATEEHSPEMEESDDDHISQLLERLEQKESQQCTTSSNNKKQRIFDQDEYKKMHNELHLYAKNSQMEWSGILEQHNENIDDEMYDENERNIAALGQSFSDCFCQDDENDDVADDDLKICDTLQSDQFHPNETSTTTQYSGIECFKRPHLPFGVRGFNCEIVRIISPTIIQILPLLREFQLRDTILQQRIQHIAPTAPHLKHFSQRTVCLARYSKDNLYYRATIRSYNPATESVDVLFVDYMHTETVSVKAIRDCPVDLANLPLRTFRVRLFGVCPKPEERDRTVCQQLAACLGKDILYARVRVRPCDADCAAGDLIQVSLHESRKSSMCVYQPLIDNGIYKHLETD